MLKTFFKISIFLLSTVLMITCNKYEFPKAAYPRIETYPVLDITDTSARFRANILQFGNKEIIDHGFVWGQKEDLSINSDFKISLSSTPSSGLFETEVELSNYIMHKDAEYFVKAYVITQDYIVYGNVKSFINTGGRASAWLRRADIPHGNYSGRYLAVAFSLNGFGYVGLGGGGVGNKFWQYDPSKDQWKEVAPFPGGERYGSACFVINGKAYVGLGGSGMQDFWSYDPQTNSWSRIADFPFAAYRAVGMSLNGEGYVVTRTATNNFWRYDPASDQWNHLPDYPRGDFVETKFELGGKLYVYSSAGYLNGYSVSNQCYTFDVGIGMWTQPGGLNGSESGAGATAFEVSGFGFLRRETTFYKFESNGGSFSPISDPLSTRKQSIAFVIGNKAYFGAGLNSDDDLWEFDPSY